MLKEKSRVKVHFQSNGKEFKTRKSGIIYEVKKQGGKIGIDFNTGKSLYTCHGDIFTPFETFAQSVIFEDVDTKKKYHFDNIANDIKEIAKTSRELYFDFLDKYLSFGLNSAEAEKNAREELYTRFRKS